MHPISVSSAPLSKYRLSEIANEHDSDRPDRTISALRTALANNFRMLAEQSGGIDEGLFVSTLNSLCDFLQCNPVELAIRGPLKQTVVLSWAQNIQIPTSTQDRLYCLQLLLSAAGVVIAQRQNDKVS